MFSFENKKMLLDLFHLYAPSNKEEPVINFVKNVLDENNINYSLDSYGNIYCFNHLNKPLLSAHMDCVGGEEDGAYVNLIDFYPYGDDEILKGIGNIGGDDKCGVFLILLYLLSGKPINAVFSVCEEIGGYNGITQVLLNVKENEVFKTIPYCIVLDRKHCGDIICNKNDYGTLEFENALSAIGKDFGYTPVIGGSSDMNKIKEYMNGCNLSVSYYNPHSSQEFVSLKQLYNTWNFLNKLIDEMPRDIPKKKIEKVNTFTYGSVSSYNDSGYSYPYYETYYDWDW